MLFWSANRCLPLFSRSSEGSTALHDADKDLPREIDFLRRNDEAMRRVMNTVEMPDRTRRSHSKLALLGDRLSGVTSVPREAVIERNGKSLVYLSRGGAWEQQEVKVQAISEGRAVVEGVSAGATVALTDPQRKSLGAKPDSGGPRMP